MSISLDPSLLVVCGLGGAEWSGRFFLHVGA